MADRRVIGLDIGSGSVRAAELSLGSSEIGFHNFGQVALPGGAVSGGVVSDPGAVTLAISRLWKEHKFSSRQVVMGVANQQVVVRAIDLPWVEPGELKQSLPYLVRDVIPLPVDQAVLDFLPLDADPAKGEKVRGLLVASPRETIATMVRCAEQAGVRPTTVDLVSFALLRAVARGTSGATTEALVDIGATVTNIVIHEWGVPQVVRIILRGGADVTAALSDRLDLSIAEAEDLKRRVGMSNPGSEEATLCGLAVTPLIEEMRSSLDYYTATHGGHRVERVRLCGGGSLLAGLRPVVERTLRTKVALTDPMADIHVHEKNLDLDHLELFRAQSAVSIGLALGAA